MLHTSPLADLFILARTQLLSVKTFHPPYNYGTKTIHSHISATVYSYILILQLSDLIHRRTSERQ